MLTAKAAPAKLERRTVGLLRRMTPEQRTRALAYDGPEASGEQSAPKLTRVRKPVSRGRRR
jgi:hypothetical protein